MTSPFGDLIQFASRNKGEGVLIEPRFYYDVINFETQGDGTTAPYALTAQQSDPDSFKNGEQFPVRLTHLIVSPQHFPLNVEGGPGVIYERPSTVQQLTLRVERYGEYYMNEQFIRASAWHNVQSAQPYNLASGTVTHKLFQPLVLSARDSLRIDFECVYPGPTNMFVPPPNAQQITINSFNGENFEPPSIVVQLSGVGMRSGRPYMLSGPARPTTDAGQTLFTVDPSLLQNIGNEPIALTDMTVVGNSAMRAQGFEENVSGLLPDVRMFRMQVRQQGNGTQAQWFKGPMYPTPINRMPLALFGTHLGASIVHRFPGDGIQLDPGEVVRVTGQNSAYGTPDGEEANLSPRQYNVGLAGYLMVT